MSNLGALAPLLTMLQQSPTLAGVSVVYGEEFIIAQEDALPMVVMVPTNESFQEAQQPGYWQGCDPYLEMLWGIRCNIDFYLWAVGPLGASDTPINNATAVEDLRANLLQAFQEQLGAGLYYKPISGKWATFNDANTRFGRGYVMTIQVEITIPTTSNASNEVTLETVTINAPT